MGERNPASRRGQGVGRAHISVLAKAVEDLASADTATDVAAVVRSAARRLTGADGIAIVLDEGDRVRYLDEDAIGPLWKGSAFPSNNCISGWAIRRRRRAIVEDIATDDRIPYELYRRTFVRSLVVTPVGRPKPFAAIGAYWAVRRRPQRAELDALDAIARATAVALENVRLRSALKEALVRAEAASRAKSTFLTNMSHELRTPLNGVVGAAELLAGGDLSSGQLELADVIRRSASDLERALGGILDFARMQSEDSGVERKAFNLADAVRGAAAPYELLCARKGLRLAIALGADQTLQVIGDKSGLTQVLDNLVGNAVKFTERGSIRISVAPGEQTDWWAIRVEDTGVGFDASECDRLFGVFEQGDATSTRRAGGAGLGLAICRRLAELMGGRLQAESRPGAGSAFTLLAPLPMARPSSETAAAAGGSETVDVELNRPLRVLVVDDHPANRRIVELILAQAGAEAHCAENGAEACRAFEEETFDLVLMDIQMPVMDGISATRQIRAMESRWARQRTPIVMLTANVLPECVEASAAAGADRHLPKPVQPAALFAAMHEVFEERRSAA